MYLRSIATSILLILFLGGFGVALGTMLELLVGRIQLRKQWQ